MPEFVVLDVEGRFWCAGRWVREYPDATIYPNRSQAKKAAERSKVLCEVVEDYGVETQRTIETVG